MIEKFKKNKSIVIIIFTLFIVMIIVKSKPNIKPETKEYIPPLVSTLIALEEDVNIKVFSEGIVLPKKEILLT